MATGIIALWMYKNEGGDKIQNALKLNLENKGHVVINNFDMRDCYFFEGQVYTRCGQNLSKVDLIYHMNADEQTLHQNEILRALEQLSVTVINNWNAFSQAKDKFTANLLLKKNGVLVPNAGLIPTSMVDSIAKRIFSEWGQVLVKPRSNHGGKGILKFQTASDFIDFIQAMNPHVYNYYLEKYIDFDDHDYRVEVFQGKVVGGYCRTKIHSYKTNIACGGLMTPKQPPIEFQTIAQSAANILGIDTTIIDMVQSTQDGKIYVLEVNPIMGIFVEAGMKSGEKSIITEIDPVFANDNLKLDLLTNYLDNVIQMKNKTMNKVMEI